MSIWGYYYENGKLEYKILYQNDDPIEVLPITESEQSKKKLFIPRKIDGRDVEFEKMVKIASDKFLTDNNIKSLRYIVKADEIWDDLDYADIDNAIRYEGEITLNDGKKLDIKKLYYNINHPELIEYSETMSGYLSYLLSQQNPKDFVLRDLEVNVESVVGEMKMDFIFVKNRKANHFFKII